MNIKIVSNRQQEPPKVVIYSINVRFASVEGKKLFVMLKIILEIEGFLPKVFKIRKRSQKDRK